jgi:hypothetical protein
VQRCERCRMMLTLLMAVSGHDQEMKVSHPLVLLLLL